MSGVCRRVDPGCSRFSLVIVVGLDEGHLWCLHFMAPPALIDLVAARAFGWTTNAGGARGREASAAPKKKKKWGGHTKQQHMSAFIFGNECKSRGTGYRHKLLPLTYHFLFQWISAGLWGRL